MQMMRTADSRWPESLQQQQATTQWNDILKTRAQNSPQMRGWLKTRQDLRAFADLVMQREKRGVNPFIYQKCCLAGRADPEPGNPAGVPADAVPG